MKRLTILLGILILLGGIIYVFRNNIIARFFNPTESSIEEPDIKQTSDVVGPQIIETNLSIPWELVFLPGGDMLVTERGGKLLKIGEDRKVIEILGVVHRGEGGLLGLALHPNFKTNKWIYIYLTTNNGNGLINRVERYTLSDSTLSDRKVILENIPGASNHDGGRISFGPDGLLYIAAGDAGDEEAAQDTKSLAGKILRIKEDGSIPSDNPFKNAVYSYGHRNIQGITWDNSGQLWATEHGRSGARSGFDEINKIVKGANYGWPVVEGDETNQNMVSPELHSGATDTWAPAGIVYFQDHIIFTGLRGESLYVADISSGKVTNIKKYFTEMYGRLRTVVLGPDQMLYVLTNNTDGRGDPRAEDDRIIKIDPRAIGF